MLLISTFSRGRPSRPAPRRSAWRAASAALPLLAACADARGAAPAAWSAPAALPASLTTFSAHDHRIADLRAGPDGSLHALFLDDADGDGRSDRLLYAAYERGAWSAPAPLDDTPGPTAGAQLVVEPGRVRALWSEGADPAAPARFDAVLQRVRVDGRWSPPARLYAAPDTAGLPGPELAAALDGEGAAHLIHPRSGEGFADLVVGDGQPAARPAGRDGSYPRLAAGPEGALALADVSTHDGAVPAGLSGARLESRGDVWVRMYRGGRWEAPVAIHRDAAQFSHAPQLAWARDGLLHAVWTEGEGGELFPTRLLHATSPDGVRWSAPRDVLSDRRGVLYSPRLAVDGGGVLRLTFARFRDGVTDPRHFHAAFDGARWSPAAEILPSLGARDSELETAVDSAGLLHAVWEGADGIYRHAILRPPGSPPR